MTDNYYLGGENHAGCFSKIINDTSGQNHKIRIFCDSAKNILVGIWYSIFQSEIRVQVQIPKDERVWVASMFEKQCSNSLIKLDK